MLRFEDKIEKYIERFSLMEKNALYLVALSGGADSVSLLLVLKKLGYRVEACHCNFHLRGEESIRDEKFCEQLCMSENIPFHHVHFDTKSYSELHHVSIEMAARNLRYSYFESLRKDLNADAICVAHHQEDSVETIIINLIRGTGIKGLRGILPKNGNIIRPLLGVNRSEIEEYLSTLNQEFVIDRTNLIDDVVRNKIRLNIIPLLEQINPRVKDNIFKTSTYLDDVYQIAEGVIEDYISHRDDIGLLRKGSQSYGSVGFKSILGFPKPQLLLYHILKEFGFNSIVSEEVLRNIQQNVIGRIWYSKTHEVLIDRDVLLIEPIEHTVLNPIKIPEGGTYVYNGHKFKFSVLNIESDFNLAKENDHITIDFSHLSWPLIIRPIKNSDRFVPFGMKGSKLVSDYLTDRKVSLFDKRRQLVLTDKEDQIIWLVGHRIADRYKVNKDTKSVLDVHLV
jgi:tRNA(Ile)-lysidine synthase